MSNAQDYDGPYHSRITKKLHKIAKEHNLKLWFKPRINAYSGEYHVGHNKAIVVLNNSSTRVISTFFHELGHHIDYHNGVFPSFYGDTPLYKQRLVALKAERHADLVGQRLCKKYFPKIKYDKSYRKPHELEYLRDYYKDGRIKD